MNLRHQSRIAAILTTAGQSTRMGQPKALLDWGGTHLIKYQIASLRESCSSEIIVVLGHDAQLVIPHINGTGVRYVINPDYAQGKTTSIKVGLNSVKSSATDIILLAIDQPRPPQIISTIVDAHLAAKAKITSPRYKGHGGHPIIFSTSLREELANITEDGKGVRAILQAHINEVNEVTIDDPIIRLDLNTPKDYNLAQTDHNPCS